MSRGDRGDRGDQGSVVILALIACALLGSFLAATLVAGVAMVARHRAQSAADLAALGGARAVLAGSDGCAVAVRIAAVNAAQVIGCRLDGPVIELTVRVGSPRFALLFPPVTGRARAGPATPDLARSGLGPRVGR